MMMARGRLRARAASMMRRVTTSMPLWALMTTATVSTAGRQARACADQIGGAGRVDEVDALAKVIGVEDGSRRSNACVPFLLFQNLKNWSRRGRSRGG
jgi:hypothetical protein